MLVSCKLGDCAFDVGCEAVVSVTLGVAGVLERRLLSESVLCRLALSLGAVILGRGGLEAFLVCLVVGIVCW